MEGEAHESNKGREERNRSEKEETHESKKGGKERRRRGKKKDA